MTITFRTRRIIFDKIPTEDGMIHHEEKERIYHDWIVAITPGNNELIFITRDGDTRGFKVVDDHEWAYKIQKTQVRAIGGAERLFKMIDRDYCRDCNSENIVPECCLNYMVYIYDNCKPVC